jgi:hypothetical protein
LGKNLLAQTKTLDQRTIAVDVLALQVIQHLATLADHLEQAATRVMILGVGLEMIGKVVDARGQQRDLNFGRAGVTLGTLITR